MNTQGISTWTRQIIPLRKWEWKKIACCFKSHVLFSHVGIVHILKSQRQKNIKMHNPQRDPFSLFLVSFSHVEMFTHVWKKPITWTCPVDIWYFLFKCEFLILIFTCEKENFKGPKPLYWCSENVSLIFLSFPEMYLWKLTKCINNWKWIKKERI